MRRRRQQLEEVTEMAMLRDDISATSAASKKPAAMQRLTSAPHQISVEVPGANSEIAPCPPTLPASLSPSKASPDTHAEGV